MEKRIELYDEDGNLLPVEMIHEQIDELYNDYLIADERPSIIENFTCSECQVDGIATLETFSFLDRSLYLSSEIEPNSAVHFTDAIRFWNKIDDIDNVPVEERKPIKVYIDTPGGDLDTTLGMIDAIQLSKTPVWTITVGSGDSGGFFIGIAGHKRIGYPHSSYLFHEGACSNAGDAHKYIQFVEFYKKKLSMLKDFVLERTNITPEQYKRHKKDDIWLTAEEALKLGIIDEIAKEII